MVAAGLRVGTWNIQWAPVRSSRGVLVQSALAKFEADILCVTEAFPDSAPADGHSIVCGKGNRYADRIGGKKVLLWSRTGWSRDLSESRDPLIDSRIASGVVDTSMGELLVIGVCIPYANSKHKDNSHAWDDHLVYLDWLSAIVRTAPPIPIILLGDFNQRVPRRRQPTRVFNALMGALGSRLSIATEGLKSGEGEDAIDHIACTPDLALSEFSIIPKTIQDRRASDHFGIMAAVQRESPQVLTPR